MSTLKSIARGALIYGLQPILTRLVSLAMLPIYTRLLSPKDYGVLQLLDTTTDVASILFTAGAISGVQRFYFKYEGDLSREALLCTAQLRLFGLAVTACVVLFALAPLLHTYALQGSGTVDQVRLSAVSLAASTLSAVPMLRLQLDKRAATYSSIALVRLVLQLSLNIFFVVFLRKGVTGILMSTLIANVLVGGGLSIWLLRTTGFRWDRRSASDLSRFGRPYRWSRMGSYVLNFGDRYFLAASRGAAEVGTYGLAYQFGFGFSQFLSGPLTRAWDPIRYELALRPASERNPVFLRVFDVANVLLFVGYTAIACFIRPTLQLLTTPEYFAAAPLVPIVVAAYLLQFWTEWFNFQINISEQTGAYAKATLLSAAITMGAYAFLIPLYGSEGAAWATLLGFSFRSALAYRIAQSLWPVPYQWKKVTTMIVTSIGATAAVSNLHFSEVALDILLGSGVFAVYCALTFLLVLDSTDRHLSLSVIFGRRSFRDLFGNST